MIKFNRVLINTLAASTFGVFALSATASAAAPEDAQAQAARILAPAPTQTRTPTPHLTARSLTRLSRGETMADAQAQARDLIIIQRSIPSNNGVTTARIAADGKHTSVRPQTRDGDAQESARRVLTNAGI